MSDSCVAPPLVSGALLLVLLAGAGCSWQDPKTNDYALLDRVCADLVRTDSAYHRYQLYSFKAADAFSWDSVYLFRSEESAEFMQAFMHVQWETVPVSNLHHRLVFTYKSQVVKYFEFDNQGPNGSRNQFPAIPIGFLTCPTKKEYYNGRLIARGQTTLRIRQVGFVEGSSYEILPAKCPAGASENL